MAAYTLVLAVAAAVWRVPARTLIVRLVPMAGLVAAALAGMAFGSTPEVAVGLAVRLILMSAAGVVVSLSLPGTLLLSGLRSLGSPATLVTLLLLTSRYLHVIGDEVLRVQRAWRSRAFGRIGLRHALSLGRAVAALTRRSADRSERIAWAMVSRGFSGQIPCRSLPPVRGFDGALGILVAACLVSMALW